MVLFAFLLDFVQSQILPQNWSKKLASTEKLMNTRVKKGGSLWVNAMQFRFRTNNAFQMHSFFSSFKVGQKPLFAVRALPVEKTGKLITLTPFAGGEKAMLNPTRCFINFISTSHANRQHCELIRISRLICRSPTVILFCPSLSLVLIAFTLCCHIVI